MEQGATHAARPDRSLTGYLLLVGLGLFWGLNWPALKVALTELPVWWFRAFSVSAGAIGLMAIAWFSTGVVLPARHEIPKLFACALFSVLGWHLCSAFGVSLMPAGRAAILAYLMPVFVALLGVPVLGERLTTYKVAGLLLGVTGLGVLIGPGFAAVQQVPLGAAFMVGAAATWATGTVLFKKFAWSSPITAITGWQLLIGAVIITPIAVLAEPVPDIAALSSDVWIALVYLVAFPMLFCQWAFLKVVSIFPAAIAAIGTLTVPVIGVYSSALILGEPVGWQEALALALISAALFVVMVLPALRRR